MKLFFFLLFAGLFSIHLSAQKIVSADLQAAGLTCAMCSNAIQKSLKTLSFVEKIEPDIKHSSFYIQFNEPSNILIESLRSRVEDAGFSVASLRLKIESEGKEIFNNKPVLIGRQYFCISPISDRERTSSFDILIIDKKMLTDKLWKHYEKKAKYPPCENPDLKERLLYHAIFSEE